MVADLADYSLATDVTLFGNIPIDIAAQTVGNVSIDIAAATVGTLDVDITAVTVGTLDVDLVAATVGTLDVDLVAQSIGNINIDIAEASVGNINIDIAECSVGNLGIDIKAQTLGVVAIDLKTATIGNLNIDLAECSVGTLDVDITAISVGTLDVDITAQTIGSIDIDINAQNLNRVVIRDHDGGAESTLEVQEECAGNSETTIHSISGKGSLRWCFWRSEDTAGAHGLKPRIYIDGNLIKPELYFSEMNAWGMDSSSRPIQLLEYNVDGSNTACHYFEKGIIFDTSCVFKTYNSNAAAIDMNIYFFVQTYT